MNITLEKIFEIIENAYKILPWWQSILIYLGIGLLIILLWIIIYWVGIKLIEKVVKL